MPQTAAQRVNRTEDTSFSAEKSSIAAEVKTSENQAVHAVYQSGTESGEYNAEAENTYRFALQMIEARSYDIAYNALSKIKDYKNEEELLKEIEDKL